MTAKKAFLNIFNPAVKLSILREGQTTHEAVLWTPNLPHVPSEGESEQAVSNTQRSTSAHILALSVPMNA